MSKTAAQVAITGAGGFLGFHMRSRLASQGISARSIAVGDSFNSEESLKSLDCASRLVHIAGVNRGTDSAVREGNLEFAKQLASSIGRCQNPPAVIVYANSIQARGGDGVYGSAKHEAGRILAEAAEAAGSAFVDVYLPNLFGEHGRPFYNSVTATFCHLLANGQEPEVQENRQLNLLHVQHAVEVLLGVTSTTALSDLAVTLSVSELLDKLASISATYRKGEIPSLASDFDRDLFNTYRSYLSPDERLLRLNQHADDRGSFFEIVRASGVSGQTSFSTTKPGITRGEHFHIRKVERFCVLSGKARISMRRLFDDAVVSFDVDGSSPVAVDMPTMWAHDITNTGTEVLYTAFWSNELFDANVPDTFSEEV